MPEAATSLPGQFLNLPYNSTVVRCPACQLVVETEININPRAVCGCFTCCLLCCKACCCQNKIEEMEDDPEKMATLTSQMVDMEHYCSNCHCFLGKGARLSKEEIKEANEKKLKKAKLTK